MVIGCGGGLVMNLQIIFTAFLQGNFLFEQINFIGRIRINVVPDIQIDGSIPVFPESMVTVAGSETPPLLSWAV